MAEKIYGLSEAFEKYGAYPKEYPQTLAELLDASPDSLKHPLAWWLRHQAVDVSNRSEAHYINTPADVAELIRKGYVIHPLDKAWKSYALSADRQPILQPNAKGSLSYQTITTRIIPKPEDLAPLSSPSRSIRKASWLLVYGGKPDVLAKPGVAPGLAKLARMKPIADVVFYHRNNEGISSFWSVRAGTGTQAGVVTGFDNHLHEQVVSIAQAMEGPTLTPTSHVTTSEVSDVVEPSERITHE